MTAALEIDQVVGAIGKKASPPLAPVQRAAGSAGETNFRHHRRCRAKGGIVENRHKTGLAQINSLKATMNEH